MSDVNIYKTSTVVCVPNYVSKTLGERHWYKWSALNNLEEKKDIQTQDGIRKNENLLCDFFLQMDLSPT